MAITRTKINKAYQKRLHILNNASLLWTARAYKAANINQDLARSKLFQRNYNTVLYELFQRGLLKDG